MNYYFDEKYHNDENIGKFFKLYEKAMKDFGYSTNIKTREDFKMQISQRTKLEHTVYIPDIYHSENIGDKLFEYYIYLYIMFLFFNIHFQRKYNLFYNNNLNYPISIFYSVNYPNRLNYYNFFNSFYILDYEIGKYYNQIVWEQHYQNVKTTVDFIEKNGLSVSDEIENMINDCKIINDVATKYFSVNSDLDYKDISNLKKIQEFENLIEENIKNNEIKNIYEKNNCINSIKTNFYYHHNILKMLLNNYHNFEEISQNNKNNSVKLQELDNKHSEIETKLENNINRMEKLKDFYLTVTGASMGLISLIVGGIALVNKDALLSHIALFNLSVISAILIFSTIFHIIYTHDYSKKENKKFLWINIVLSIITVLSVIIILIKEILKS